MTTIDRRALRFQMTVAMFAGLTLAACGGGDATGLNTSGPLSPGQGTPVNGASALTIDGGSTGTENVLVVVDTGLGAIATKTNYQVTATGTGAAGAVSAPATALIPLTGAAPIAATSAAAPTLDIAYGMRLNARSQSRFAGKFEAARAAFRSGSALPSGMSRSLGVAAPQVGDIVTVNVQTDSACSKVINRGARVVAISAQSIVLSDTLNPTGGFSTADYQRFAARFDTLVYPVDVANFGTPADIDKNGKVVLLFTSAVNALTPRNSTSYVGGFFYDRDLFPITNAPPLPGCAGSNYAEMFYLLAPDPAGVINGNQRPTAFVDSVTTSILAHEFQHLINASRRLYVTQGVEAFEETWLNEGLSHVAEELLFFHIAGLTSRQNIDTLKLRSSETIRNSFNNDMLGNAGRYREFLVAPSENSPFRDDDSLATRGATWNLLRYLADRKGGTESATWQALVNTARTGLSNLTAVFGTDIASKVHDWNVSHYTDDVVSGLPSEHTQPSWNWHGIYKATSQAKAYPLQVKSLAAGSTSGTLIGGAAAYYRFSVPAGTSATVSIPSAGPIYARVVRLR